MAFYAPVLGTVVGLQSLALVGRAAKMVPKDIGKASKRKPTKPTKKIIGGFTDIMVGTALLKPTASIIKSL